MAAFAETLVLFHAGGVREVLKLTERCRAAPEWDAESFLRQRMSAAAQAWRKWGAPPGCCPCCPRAA